MPLCGVDMFVVQIAERLPYGWGRHVCFSIVLLPHHVEPPTDLSIGGWKSLFQAGFCVDDGPFKQEFVQIVFGLSSSGDAEDGTYLRLMLLWSNEGDVAGSSSSHNFCKKMKRDHESSPPVVLLSFAKHDFHNFWIWPYLPSRFKSYRTGRRGR